MKAWNYQELAEPLREHFFGSTCPYCATGTVWVKDGSCIGIPDANEVIDTPGFSFCPVCGWWVVHHFVMATFGESHPYGRNSWQRRNYGIAGALRNLDIEDLSIPVDEVRSFLAAKWQSRFDLHPRLFEEVVGSVFKSLGYSVRVTAYSGDGGIDVILDSPEGKTIGIQVKRWKNRISVEQIRSFVGALYVNGYTSGIFVTTSDFQKGCAHIAAQSRHKSTEIELLDAKRFYEALRIAQVRDNAGYPQQLERLVGQLTFHDLALLDVDDGSCGSRDEKVWSLFDVYDTSSLAIEPPNTSLAADGEGRR